jgi:hypothetical protein
VPSGDNSASAEPSGGAAGNGLFMDLLENPFPLFRMML